MSDSLLQWAAAFGMVCIAIIFLTELRRWRSLANVIGRKQRVMRVWLIVLMELLFLMMFASPWVTGRHDMLVNLLYWMICLIVGLVVIVLALLDLREVAKGYANLNRRMFGDLKDDGRREK
jgi:hypothetical protein